VLDFVLNIVEQTVEYRGFGLNALTVGAAGALALLLFEAWALIQQARTIWRDRSADILSTYWFGYTACFAAAYVPYGIAIQSGTLVFTCTVWSALHIPILWGIHKFRGYTAKETVTMGAFVLMVPVMIWLPWIDLAYLVFSVGMVYAFATQTWELWKEEKTGSLEIKLLAVYIVSTTFWTIYVFAINALALMILNPVILTITIATVTLWCKYKKRELAAAASNK